MRFERRSVQALCLTALIAGLLGCGACMLNAQASQQPKTATTQAQPPAAGSKPVEGKSGQAQPASTEAYTLPPKKLAEAVTLSHIRVTLYFAGSLWGIAFLWLLLATRAAAGLAAWCERLLSRRWLQGLLFFAALLFITTLAALPLELIGHAVSRHYGLSVQGWSGWLGDQGKALGLSLLIGSPVLLLFNWIVRVSPRRYWFWGWLISLPLLVLSFFISPLLAPIFNKFEPLSKSNPALVAKLEKVVARTGMKIPPSRIYLMKASSKYTGLNAYVSGIGSTKRIVVWDTTAGRIPDDEILFIFGHESGHYVLHHIPKMICGMAVGLFFLFWGCAWCAERLARRYGERWNLDGTKSGPHGRIIPLASRQGFVVLLFVLSIASFLSEPVSNTFSRYFEHQADIYGQEAIHGLVPNPQKTAVAAFNRLGEAWLEDPNPNPFVEFWCYSHPSVQQRADFAAHYNPWANGGHGKYFAR